MINIFKDPKLNKALARGINKVALDKDYQIDEDDVGGEEKKSDLELAVDNTKKKKS